MCFRIFYGQESRGVIKIMQYKIVQKIAAPELLEALENMLDNDKRYSAAHIAEARAVIARAKEDPQILTINDIDFRAQNNTMPVVAYKNESGAICRLLNINGRWQFITIAFTQDTALPIQYGWICTPKATPGEALLATFNSLCRHRHNKEIYAFDTERDFIQWVFNQM
jgi:hypothetical protein